MTKEEVLCDFMEPRDEIVRKLQEKRRAGDRTGIELRWWVGTCKLVPREITLNECHEIEARLTNEQWADYETDLWHAGAKRRLHATAEQKIAALAAVLRAAVL